MRRMTVESRYIPKGAVKVADKKSDAVAYLYQGGDAARFGGGTVPCARVFWGKQSKPVLAMQFATEAARTAKVTAYFKARQDALARKAADRATLAATGRGVQIGQFLVASWGYDQTNVNFYKVTKLVGKAMAEVVAVPWMDVGQAEGGSSMSTRVMPAEEPLPGAATYRVLVKAGRATINDHHAHTWDGKPAYCSWYA